ncbi:MAG: SpoIVB peptidase S55 domain-containing protein [Bryobacteraceae bacterium]
MLLLRFFGCIAIAATLHAAPAIFPLKDIRAGQHGVGRTVFSGSRVEEFDVEILGVLENMSPKESIILGRLKGGPLEHTGVMQGMSGSPVYIDGKLAGAVALSFPYSKDAIAGIRPVEDMLRVEPDGPRVMARQRFMARDARLEEIATPVSFSGFTSATLEHFGVQLREMGMDPRQGVSGGGKPTDRMGDPKNIEPGSMISAQLLTGDYSISADGTVTLIDGDHVYAFGHRFMDSGPSDVPFARAEVLALLPNLNSSFKISAAREWMGTLTDDRSMAVSGVMGRRAAMAPIDIHVGKNVYHMQVVQDRVMTPLVTQMALFSAIDATERAQGGSTFSVTGHLDFEGGSVRVDNVYSGDVAVAALAALGVGTSLNYAMASGFDAFKLKGVTLNVGVVDRKSQVQIADIAAPRSVRPGENVELIVTLEGENGAESQRKVMYRVPVGAPPGPINFTAADASTTNVTEFGASIGLQYHSPGQVLEFLNGLRSNTKAYIRVWRNEASYTIDGRDLPSPPPSVAMILSRAQTQAALLQNLRGSKLAEIEISAGDSVVTGTKTVQVEVKEQ